MARVPTDAQLLTSLRERREELHALVERIEQYPLALRRPEAVREHLIETMRKVLDLYCVVEIWFEHRLRERG